MTIPTLVSKYQKHTYVTGLKKAYSTLSNAMALAMHDDEVWEYEWDGDIDWYNSTKNIIKKYMKVVKTCQHPNLGDCVEVNDYGDSIQGWSDTIYVTADGMTWSSTAGPTVDINGKKGPNKWGRDIFVFEMAYSDRNGVAQGTVIPIGSKLYAKFRGNDTEYWNNNPSSPRCTTEIVNQHGKDSGFWSSAGYCTGRVLEEGAMNY